MYRDDLSEVSTGKRGRREGRTPQTHKGELESDGKLNGDDYVS